jgi:hypothetical protein
MDIAVEGGAGIAIDMEAAARPMPVGKAKESACLGSDASSSVKAETAFRPGYLGAPMLQPEENPTSMRPNPNNFG